MKALTAVVALLVGSTAALPAQSGSTPAAFIAARQPEVDRIAAMVYATQLNDGRWTRHEVSGCEIFPHHAFARFDSSPVNGTSAHMLAIYDLRHPPARSLRQPWQGGVTLLLLESRRQQNQNAGPREPSLLTAVNRLIQQAHVHDTAAVARCIVGLSGEQPAPPTPAADGTIAPTASQPPATSVLTTLVSPAAWVRTESVTFDAYGIATEAAIEVHRVQP